MNGRRFKLSPKVFSNLSERRLFFYSEADFQLALAWTIHDMFQGMIVFPEYPLSREKGKRRRHLDIMIESERSRIGIELKYKTRKIPDFDLQNQGARDVGRYKFLQDIERLETIILDEGYSRGYAVLLTNDPGYWEEPENQSTIDRCFQIHEGERVFGVLHWDQKDNTGTKKHHKEEITIRGDYTMKWRDYSIAGSAKYSKFRFLLVTIVKPDSRVPRRRCPRS